MIRIGNISVHIDEQAKYESLAMRNQEKGLNYGIYNFLALEEKCESQ
jgi:hypothetical protein